MRYPSYERRNHGSRDTASWALGRFSGNFAALLQTPPQPEIDAISLIAVRMRAMRKQAGDQTGSEIVEFGLVILPLLAVMFLILDISWIFFAQATLQYAAGTGVRYAITSNVMKGPIGLPLGQDVSIKSIIQQNSMGFLAGQAGLDEITINYYSPSAPSKPLMGPGSNAGGNIIEISVKGVQVNPLGFVWPGGPTTLFLAASSTDVMESSPGGLPPPR